MFSKIISLTYPIFSLQEMHYTPDFILSNLHPSYWWIMRCVSIAALVFIFFIIRKKYPLRPIGVLFVLTTPWIFILAREYNPYVSVLLIILGLLFAQKTRPAVLLSLGLFTLLLVPRNTSIHFIMEKLELLKTFFSFNLLFFQMESNSFYLSVPKIGYFSSAALPVLLLSLYWKNFNRLTIIAFIISLFFYFLYPTNHFIFAGAGMLFVLQIIMLAGLTKLSSKKIIAIIMGTVFILNFIFFLEIYTRHYPKLYGGERGYNEFQVFQMIIRKNPSIVYLPEHNSLKMIHHYYQYHYDLPEMVYYQNRDLPGLGQTCLKEEILCFFNDEALRSVKLNQDPQELEVIRNPADLPIYYIL